MSNTISPYNEDILDSRQISQFVYHYLFAIDSQIKMLVPMKNPTIKADFPYKLKQVC